MDGTEMLIGRVVGVMNPRPPALTHALADHVHVRK